MIAVSTSPHRTAEWQCAKCGTTNRKFVGAAETSTADRCVSCRTKHAVSVGKRPVRWDARAL